jgi:alpha/beta superfamily hydrolase
VTLFEVRSGVELPANRTPFILHTQDGQSLVAELAMPVGGNPVATLICLHPLPTHGGFMDSHVMRKAANRLPHLANIAVLRFNTRGTESPQGKSSGEFTGGDLERYDLAAAVDWAVSQGLEHRWLLGWSFGTELTLKYGSDKPIDGAILLSPPLHRTSQNELERWNQVPKRVIGLIPEFDDYLTPEPAALAFSVMRNFEQINVAGAKHLWVGEDAVTRVLNEIVRVVNPAAYPLPKSVEI